MQRLNIDTVAMLVEFNASMWTARKLDRTTSDEVVANKNAGAKDAARVNKHLLAGRNELEVIQQHIGKVRNWVYDNTTPWSDAGMRLLPVINFLKFDKKLREEEELYWKNVDHFVNIYPTLITAQAMALGDMFKRDDFPPAHTIKAKFGFSFNYMPVPSKGDWRIDVGNDARAELEAQLEKMADARVKAAMDGVRDRLREYLVRASDRLTVDVVEENGDQTVKPRRFHDSLVESGFELCDIVKALNVVQDTELEKARAALEKCLCGITPTTIQGKKANKELSIADTLREDLHKREQVKAQVDAVLNQFNW